MSSVSKSTQFYSGFSPQSIPGLALWLDAADSRTLTLSGSNVTAWADKSPGSNNSTSVVGTPTWGSNFINGRPAINIASNGFHGAFSNTITGSQVTCFMAYVPRNGGSYPRYLSLGDGVNGEYYSQQGFLGFGVNAGANIGCSRGTYITVSNALNVAHIATSIADLTTNSIVVDGSLNLTTANSGFTGNFSMSRWGVGVEQNAWPNSGNGWNPQFYLGEILVYSNVALPTYQRRQIEGYLAWKWGVQSNIPTGHLSRYAPPPLRGFQPTDISGCTLWLDGADGSSFTFSSGSNISLWNDKTSNNRNAVAVQSTIVLQQNAQNGNSAVRLPAAGSGYFDVSYTGFPNSNLSMFSAQYFSGNDTSIARLVSAPGGANGSLAYTELYPIRIRSGDANFVSTSFNHGGVWHMTGMDISSTGASTGFFSAYVDTSLGATANTASLSSFSTIRVGASATDGSWQWRGDIGEIVMFDRKLSTLERQLIEGYFMEKWGLRGNMLSTHPFKLTRALNPPFNPLAIGDCRLWLDAAEPSTFTYSGSNITGWRDKSEIANHQVQNGYISATFSNDPVYNRFGVLFSNARFNNSNGAINTISNTNVYSIFTVHRFLTGSTGTVYRGPSMIWFRWGNFITDMDPAGYIQIGSDYNVTNGTSSFINDVSTATAYLNGTSAGTASKTSNVSNIQFNIGAQADLGIGEWFGGYMFELLFFNKNLTQADRQRVEGYLAWKWGLQSKLPASHPFKKVAP